MNAKKLITVEIAYASSLVIPLSVSYTPSDWHRWSDLKSKMETKKGEQSDRFHFTVPIPHEVGVYEVRATFDHATWIHVGCTGRAGLYARLSQLLNLKSGMHSHRKAILCYLKKVYYERKGIKLSDSDEGDKEATKFLELRWSTCDQPELLELLLHMRYKPILYDEVLFPHGIHLQAIPTDYQQMLSAQDNEPIPDDELI